MELDPEKFKEFQKELQVLLDKYQVQMTIAQKILVQPRETPKED